MKFKDLLNFFKPKKRFIEIPRIAPLPAKTTIQSNNTSFWTPIPNYVDYRVLPSVQDMEEALNYFMENEEDFSMEFRQNFKKRMKRILDESNN